MNHKLLISILLGATLLTTSSLVAMDPQDLLNQQEEKPICKLQQYEERLSKLFHKGDNEEEEEQLRAFIQLERACAHSCSGCNPKHVGSPTVENHIVHKELFMSYTFLEKYDSRTGGFRSYSPEDYPLSLLADQELARQKRKREKKQQREEKQQREQRKQSRG